MPQEIIEKMKKFVSLGEFVEKIANSEHIEWDEKFQIIFGQGICVKMTDLFEIEWCDPCDPHMGYENDVRAFISAAVEKSDRIKKMLEEDFKITLPS